MCLGGRVVLFDVYEKLANIDDVLNSHLVQEDHCNGDGGGPLLSSSYGPKNPMYLVGITSFGSKECGTVSLKNLFQKITSISYLCEYF